MKSSKNLPTTHVRYDKFGVNQYKNMAKIFLRLGFLLALPYYLLFNWLSGIIRPSFETVVVFNPAFRFTNIFTMLIVTVVVIIIHEWIHVLSLWFFIGERPNIEFGLVSAHVNAPSWFLARNPMLFSNIAPLVLLTAIGLILQRFMPRMLIEVITFGLTVNAAGSIPDLMSSLFISLFPESTFLTTNGRIYMDKDHLGKISSHWKYQSIVERIISILS